LGSPLSTLETHIRTNLQEATPNYYLEPDIFKSIGEAYRYYSMILLEQGEGYFVSPTPSYLNLVANTPNIDLSALSPVFFSVVSVERGTATGSIPLQRWGRRFKPNSTLLTGVGNGYLPHYQIYGNQLILEPTPTGSETGSSSSGLILRYNYIPIFPDNSSLGSFTFDAGFPTLFEPLVEIYATLDQIAGKELGGANVMVDKFEKALAKWEDRFMSSMKRSESPERVDYIGINYNNLYGF
jgi:hypothetical protein